MTRRSPLVGRLAVSAVVVLVGGLVAALTAGRLSSPATWVIAIAFNVSLIVLGVCGTVLLARREPPHEDDVIRR